MSDATEVLTVQEGQAAVKQVAVSGEIISLPSATDVKAIVQTDKGPVAAVKTVSLGGGGGASGNFVEQLSTMPEASTKQGKIVQYVGTEAGTYNHGAFYESVAQSGGTNSYSDFYYQREADVTDTDALFGFVNIVLESDGQSPLAVGDSVAIGFWQAARTDYEETEEGLNYIKRTNSAGVSQTVKVTDEWLGTNCPDGAGLDLSGGVPEYVSFTVTGVAATTYVWQETTVDKLLEAMVENNASVLHTTSSLATSRDFTKSISLTSLTAYSSLDSRPSHKAPGAIVINDNKNQIGIITEVNSRNATVVTVFTGFTGTGVPSGGGAYKVLGSASSSTPTWVEALVISDVAANSTNAGSTYFGGKPFMSKTGSNGTTKFQSYTVVKQTGEATYSNLMNSREGEIDITDAAVLYEAVQSRWIDSGAGFGTITKLESGQTLVLDIYIDDYHGPDALQYNVGIRIQDPYDGSRSYTGNSLFFSSYSLQTDLGITSTATSGGSATISLTVGSLGGETYSYESQGCAKIQGATETDPTYVFSMPGNMVMMGGIVDLPSMGPGVAVENTPVDFPKSLSTGNYVVQLTVITESGFQQIAVDASNRTTAGFNVCSRNNDASETVTGAKVAWTVVGVAPLSGQA